MRYGRDELEALRGAPSSEAQVLRWAEVLAALAAAGFSEEYDGLHAKGKRPPGRGGRKRHEAAAAAAVAGQLVEETEAGAWRNGAVGDPFDQAGSAEWEDDSDDEYHGILKPAFAVDGEPDFESGEPLDGFEYLRRVRWEANQFPRVKVAKIDLSTASNEQTPYMPEIPDIPKCSSDLCASKEWEDKFITYFSETRMAFSELDISDGASISGELNNSSELGSIDVISRAATLRNYWWEANQIPRVKVAKIDLSTASNEQTPYIPEVPGIPKCSSDLCASKEWEDKFITYFSETRMAELDISDGASISRGLKNSSEIGSSSEPTLSMLHSMDAVSRAAKLRKYIDMIQSMDTLSRNDSLWLFALCVAVETPLDADTCASLRSLLRKCSTILAAKSEMDDEVGMLNILIAISGRYFGQYEK